MSDIYGILSTTKNLFLRGLERRQMHSSNSTTEMCQIIQAHIFYQQHTHPFLKKNILIVIFFSNPLSQQVFGWNNILIKQQSYHPRKRRNNFDMDKYCKKSINMCYSKIRSHPIIISKRRGVVFKRPRGTPIKCDRGQ